MDWLTKLKDYAPDIAMAIATGGASLPQLALKAVADAVGSEVSSELELQSLVEANDPTVRLKLTQANNSFKIRMRELDNELLSAELSDKKDARRNHKHSIMPAFVTAGMTVIMGALFYALFFEPIPVGNKDVLYLLAGQASALWGASVTYWVGTTRSSAEKTFKPK